MDVKARQSLQFDALEGRVLLSVARVAHSLSLSGTLQIPVPADTSSLNHISIEGNGNVRPLGPVSALGTLTGGSGGIVDLASGGGGIVLSFSTIAAHGHKVMPALRFTITGGTGSYTDASGHGTANEDFVHGSDTLALKLHGTLQPGS